MFIGIVHDRSQFTQSEELNAFIIVKTFSHFRFCLDKLYDLGTFFHDKGHFSLLRWVPCDGLPLRQVRGKLTEKWEKWSLHHATL